MALYLGIIISLVVFLCNCLSADCRYCSGEYDTYPADSLDIKAGAAPPDDSERLFKVDKTKPNLDFGRESLFDLSLETAFECFEDEEEYVEPCTEVNMHCQPMSSGYNAPAVIDFGCFQDVFSIWVSFLYWDASQSNMDIALKSPYTIRNDACGNSFTKGKGLDMHTSYQPGFSVGLSHTFICFDDWDISAEYTHLHSQNSRSAVEPTDGFLYARWIQPNLISNNAVSCLHDCWELDFNILNVELGRRCYMGRRFIVRPYIGLAAAFIDQKFKGEMDILFPTPFTLHVVDKSDSWALGPRIGVDGNWYLTRCFSIAGNIAGDILFTHYHINLNQYAIDNSTIFLDSSDKVNTLRQELELYLGLRYEFLDCCYYFSLEAGYDFQIWWNQNMIRWFNDNSFICAPQGNLYLQGLRITFKVAF
jgi:hypothetical protein